MQIYMSCFDHNEYNEKIGAFCEKSCITDAVRKKIELAFEELVCNNIAVFIEHNDDRGLPISVMIEHYGVDDATEMTITYGGDRYDPVYEGDELSSVIAKKIFGSVKYRYDDGNVLVVVIE